MENTDVKLICLLICIQPQGLYGDYPTYKKKGYFVGIGAIESGNIRFMQNRMKLQEMRWKLESAQGMLSLKSKYELGRWDEVIDPIQKKGYGK